MASLASDARSPIFIGGQRRSGTSLLRVCLNRHPNIACGPESKLIQPDFVTWHEHLVEEWSPRIAAYRLPEDAIDRAVAAMFDNIFTRYQVSQGKKRWAEKTPTNIERIDYVFRLFPHAQFVHVIRDPRDTFCSIRERMERDRPDWVKFTASRSAKNWRQAIGAGRRWRVTPDRYAEVRYEDLVLDPEATLRTVLDFLHEPWDAAVLDPDADNEEARSDPQIRSGRFLATSVGRWKDELSRQEVADIEQGTLKLMVELGYAAASAGNDSKAATTLSIKRSTSAV